MKDEENAIRNPHLLSYGVAVFSTALVLIASLSLRSLIQPTSNVLFFIAVMVSAWYGGLGPGLAATILSALAISYYFFIPFNSLGIAEPGSAIRLGVFMLVALLISGLNESRRSAIRREQQLRAVSEGAQQESQAAKERLETLLASIHDGFYTLDRHWRYTYVNDRYCEMAGMPPEALLGQDIWQIFPAAVDTDFYVQLQQARREQTSLQFEYLYAPWNCWYEHRVYPSADGLTVFITEITDRKQAEAALQQSETRFRLMAETIQDAFWITDFRNPKILYVSPAYEQIWGRSPEAIYQDYTLWADTIHPDDRERVLAIAATCQSNEQVEQEYRIVRPDGTIRWIRDRGYAVYDEVGQIQQVVGVAQDITERKLAVEALKRSEAKFRRLVEVSMFGVAIGDFSGNLLYANDSLLKMIGYSREELEAGQIRWLDLTPPEQVYLDWQAAAELRQQGVCKAFEKEYIRKDGQRVPILIGAALLGEPYAEQEQIIGFYLDLTELKQAEREREQLLERERTARVEAENERHRLQEFFLKAPAMIAYVRGPQYVYELANPTYLQVAGRQAEALIGHPLREVFPEIESQGFFDILDEVYRSGVPFSGTETRVLYNRHNNGILREAYFNFVYQPLRNAGGEVEGILMHAIDVTVQVEARRRTEELANQLAAERSLLEAVLQQMPAGVIIAEVPSGKLILGNQQVEQIWRRPFFASTEIGEYCEYQGFHPDGRRYRPEEWPLARAVATGKVVAQEEIRFLRGDGTYGIMEVNAAPVRDRQGQIVAGVVTFQDISDRKQSEQEREQLLASEQAARAEAEAANRIKDEFLAVLSHELRSPLNPILGWARLLQTQKMSEAKTAQALATIERNAKLQTQLIEDLLDVSRILRGKLSLTVVPVNLAAIVAAAIETVQLAAEMKGIDLRFAAIGSAEAAEQSRRETAEPRQAAPSPLQVMGDPTRLQQIVWNLLSNAVKFTPAGGRVEVQLEQVVWERPSLPQPPRRPAAPPPYAQITVTDTGKGISPDFLPYVFDYFRQEDGKTTRKFGGLGLGLAIVRHLVELHGGTVHAESQGDGQGAIFTVRLPLTSVAVASDQTTATTDETVDLSHLRILVVDDEEDMRDLARVILEQHVAQVWVAASAAEALLLFDRHLPDLLISDIGMPHVDGYMLMQQIRQRPPSAGGVVPAIALTAYAGEFNQQQAIAAGFQQHLAKPVDPNELIKAIAALVAHELGY